MRLFHIVESTVWAAAKERGTYAPASLASEGFIHLSEKQQVAGTIERFYKEQIYKEQTGLVLLEIDPKLLHSVLQYNQVPGHGIFPHLYGALNLEAVVRVWASAALWQHSLNDQGAV